MGPPRATAMGGTAGRSPPFWKSSTAQNRRRRSRGDDAAAARMKKIPAFVRGMVVKAVEESCRKSGLDRVTVEELERIRARMPTPKFFG
jgi:hypothetical protein